MSTFFIAETLANEIHLFPGESNDFLFLWTGKVLDLE